MRFNTRSNVTSYTIVTREMLSLVILGVLLLAFRELFTMQAIKTQGEEILEI